MKVRVATLLWRDGYGGAERSIRDLAAALDPDNIEMRFLYLKGPLGVFAEEIAAMGYIVKNLNWRNGFSLAGRLRLLNELHHFDPMIVHDHIIPPLTRPMVKIIYSRPILHTEHGAAMRHATGQVRWRRSIERFDLQFADLILANSIASKNAVKQAYHYPSERIQILYLGIDLDRFMPTNKNKLEHTWRLGYTGRIHFKHKGTDYLPRVARVLVDNGFKDIEFIIAGDGPDRQALEALCQQLSVDHLFTFLGFYSDVHSLLSTLDVLLVPSRFESFGLSALEALAVRVPVVGFDVGGLSEVVKECGSVILVPPGDIGAMAKAIVKIMKLSPKELNTSRDFVKKHFSNKRMALELQEIYREYAT